MMKELLSVLELVGMFAMGFSLYKYTNTNKLDWLVWATLFATIR